MLRTVRAFPLNKSLLLSLYCSASIAQYMLWINLTYLFDLALSRSPPGLQVPQVFSRQALHHWLLPQAPRFFGEDVWEPVIKKRKKRKQKNKRKNEKRKKFGKKKQKTPLPLGLRRGMCLHFFACSFPPDDPHHHLWSTGKHTLLIHFRETMWM